jgi:hypothetical protein
MVGLVLIICDAILGLVLWLTLERRAVDRCYHQRHSGRCVLAPILELGAWSAFSESTFQRCIRSGVLELILELIFRVGGSPVRPCIGIGVLALICDAIL